MSSASIASYNADLAEKEAEALQRSEVAKRKAQSEIERAQYELEGERLRAAEIAREEVSKQQIEIAVSRGRAPTQKSLRVKQTLS